MTYEIIYKKIEKGQQLGVEKKIEKDNKMYWYSYAVQKINSTYYVYEREVAEDRILIEGFEMEDFSNEKVNKFLSIQEVEENFIGKYNINSTFPAEISKQCLNK